MGALHRGLRLFVAALVLAIAGCPNSVSLPGDNDGGLGSLPLNREGQGDGGTPSADAGTPGETDGGAPADPVDGGAPDDGGVAPESCQVWSDCGPFYSDPNSGYGCVDQTCVCDPGGNAQQNCAAAGGAWRADLCYCQPAEPPPIGGACQVWQDCGPHYGDMNSGFECVNATCSCDPSGQYAGRCGQYGGYWIADECYCAFAGQPPPAEDPGANCYWHWEAPPCDPDRWVDTSHYEQECSYDTNGDYVCDSVWVESGYWEDGACPAGYWERRC